MKIKKKYKKQIETIAKRSGMPLQDVLNELLENGLAEYKKRIHIESVRKLGLYRLDLSNNVSRSLSMIGISTIGELEEIEDLKKIPGIGFNTENYIRSQINKLMEVPVDI